MTHEKDEKIVLFPFPSFKNLLLTLIESVCAKLTGSLCLITICVALSLKPKSKKASFLPNLNTLYASIHSEFTLTPDDYLIF